MSELLFHDTMDPFTRLPDEIIAHILSFLSTKEAAATSILSARWQHLWKLTGHLFIPTVNGDDDESIQLVDSVLSSFENPNLYPLRELSIVCNFFASMHGNVAVERWVSFAIDRHDVHVLRMSIFMHQDMVDREFSFPLPSSCNRMNNLVHLDLCWCKILPSFECFRNLRSIFLDANSVVTDAAFESINRNCTLLEKVILFARLPEHLRVSSSLGRLKYLWIHDCRDLKTIFIDSPSLEELMVAMRAWKPTSLNFHLFAPNLKGLTLHFREDISAILALIEGFSIGRIEKLCLHLENLDHGLNFDFTRPCRLNHVKELILKESSLDVSVESEGLKVFEALLRASSSLESLSLSFDIPFWRRESSEFDTPVSGGNLTLQSLERIRMEWFDHREYSHLMMLKYLVEAAVRLVEIEIEISRDLSASKKCIKDCIGDKLCHGVKLLILPVSSGGIMEL